MRRAWEDMAVRRAGVADLPAVTRLDAEVTGSSKPSYWRDVFERSPFFLVAERDGIEGFIVGEVRAWEFGSPPCGWVFAVQIRRNTRLRGLGTRLFEALCDAFRAAGVQNVRTMVARGDAVLLSFFRSQGMTAGPFIQLELPL